MVNHKPSKLIIFLIVFLDLLGFGTMIPMLPFFGRHFGADSMEIGWLMFVYSGMQIVVSPFWGQLSDRYGRRPILLVTIAGQAAAFIWAGLAPTYTLLLISRIFAGIFAANISTANAYMADISSKEDRAKSMGLIGAAFGLGFIFGPAIGGLLIPYGYEWPSFFSGALGCVNLVLAMILLKEPLQDEIDRQKNRRRVNFAIYKECFSNAAVFTPMILFFILTLAFVQLEVTFGLYVMDRFGLHERQAGFLFAGMGVVMAIVQGGLIGRFVKKFGELGTLRWGMPAIVLGLCGLIVSPTVPLMCASLLVMAAGYSLSNPCLSALTSKNAPADRQGSVLGIYQSMGSLARVMGPLAGGALYKYSQVGAFTGSAVLIIIAKIVFGLSYSRTYTAPK